MEYILLGYICTILFHMSRSEMFLKFEVALNIEKQGLTTSLHEKRNYFPNNLIKRYSNFYYNSNIETNNT